MKICKRWATLLLCSVAVAVVAGPAMARPVHHRHQAVQLASQPEGADRDMRYSLNRAESPVAATAAAAGPASTAARHSRRGARTLEQARIAAQSHTNSAYGGFTANSLVAEARKYIGTNPTGRGSLWCGAFMDMVLKHTGHSGGGNLAWGYRNYGTRVAGPQVGAIAVMRGHVGVVSGVDANGNPIIVSGNHNHTVAEAVYPRSRISTYVMP
jgi:uncharacterized protein (TIGR02594 family)